jgi:hypothetical protein
MLTRPPDDAEQRAKRRRRREQKTASARRARREEYFLRGLLVTPAMRGRMVRLGQILSHEADDREVVEKALIELVMREVLHL